MRVVKRCIKILKCGNQTMYIYERSQDKKKKCQEIKEYTLANKIDRAFKEIKQNFCR